MGITILGNVGKIIEDNHGEMYFDNAKKIVSAEQLPQQRVVEDIVPIEDKQVTSPAEPDLERLQKYFSNNYLTTRHAEYVAMIDICCGDFTDREKAYFAWKIYDTDTIMNSITRPKTFSAWYEIFCEIFHVTHHTNYYPKDIKTPSDNAKIIDNYVYAINRSR